MGVAANYTRAAGIASGAWAFYAGYEYLMYARVLCSGEWNIRVDLLLIYPVLVALTVTAVYASLRRRQPSSA